MKISTALYYFVAIIELLVVIWNMPYALKGPDGLAYFMSKTLVPHMFVILLLVVASMLKGLKL